jgi:16S rRNA G966 N2-methylase RsmD
MDIYQKAYNWALTYNFKPIKIEYASKLALKMLDDACQMDDNTRKVFFFVYDTINKLIYLARDRNTIFSKPPYREAIHNKRLEVIPNMLKVHMKEYKSMVREHLDF